MRMIERIRGRMRKRVWMSMGKGSVLVWVRVM